MATSLPTFGHYLTVKEAAAFLGIAESTIRNWDRSGKMRATRHPVNGYRLYDPVELERLLTETKGPAPVGKPAAGPSQPAEIVLVEDNPRDAELICRALKKTAPSHPVRVLRDGEVALEYFFREAPGPRPKLVLLDLRLPKIDGLDVLRRIKGDPATNVLPVVVLTSCQEDQDVCESYRLGVGGYILKDVDQRRFNEAIGALGAYWLGANRLPGQPDAGGRP